MATSTMMWLFIIVHVVALVVLGVLLAKMEVASDEEIEEAAGTEEVL